MANDGKSFFAELKRRNVYRVGIAYVIVGWLALQALDIVVPIMRAPEWFSQLVLVLLLIGLPFALIFAWAYEMTPEGLKREKDVDRTESITQETGQRINKITTTVLVLAVGILLVDKFFLDNATPEVVIEAVEQEVVEDATPSIAVLPFANMSADESSAYFSDGLADTLLHMLAQIREIRVAARTSSFQFRDQNTDIKEIAKTLNVGTILEGSVQRAGNKVRVTAQLIEADTGFHLWSGNYDRDLDDIFAIQDEIAIEVVAALKISLLGDSAEILTRRDTENLEAYTEYLLGVEDLAEFSFESLPKAETHFREAVRLDPNYALAWAQLGDTYLQMQQTGAGKFDEMIEAARDAASRSLEIDANQPAALAVLGVAESRAGNGTLAEQLLSKAIEAGPNDITAKIYYARLLWGDFRPHEGLAQMEQVLTLDPLSTEANNLRALILGALGEYDEALIGARKTVAVNPASPMGYYREAMLEYQHGNWANAVVKTMEAMEVDPSDPELAMLLGDYYLSMELPVDAQRWYDRTTEIDATHAVSRASPLNTYLYFDDIETAANLARKLLDEGIEDRQDSKSNAVLAIWASAKKNGNHQESLNLLQPHFGSLFEDEPDWNWNNSFEHVAIGSMMISAGDIDRGRYLLDTAVRRSEKARAVYQPGVLGTTASAGLGDKDGALRQLREFTDSGLYPGLWPIQVRNSPAYELIRDEPEFIEWVDSLEKNAAEQRVLLAELLAE